MVCLHIMQPAELFNYCGGDVYYPKNANSLILMENIHYYRALLWKACFCYIKDVHWGFYLFPKWLLLSIGWWAGNRLYQSQPMKWELSTQRTFADSKHIWGEFEMAGVFSFPKDVRHCRHRCTLSLFCVCSNIQWNLSPLAFGVRCLKSN